MDAVPLPVPEPVTVVHALFDEDDQAHPLVVVTLTVAEPA
jgi:hypothetical protein